MYFFRRSFVFLIVAICILTGAAFSYSLTHVFAADADPCSATTEGKSHAELQADLDACTADIQKWNDVLATTQKTSATYASEVKALTAKINAAQANINAKSVAIATLGKDITAKQTKINQLSDQIDAGRDSLAVLLRKTHELDSYTLADAMLSNKDLSEFFTDNDAYSSTQKALQAVEDQLNGNKATTESEKADLAKQQQAAADAKAAIEQTKAQVQANQAEQQTLLNQSKDQEKVYSQVLADKQAKASQIRAALFDLRDSGAIPFGTALQYAIAAQTKTGVDPAFLLAILTQESSLGQNVGSCVITNLTTGETKNVNTGKVYPNGIHPTRDLPVLQTLLKQLGRDPLTTKVSCPLSIGYGGGMGPAQFIPSTWYGKNGAFQAVIAKATGDAVPDPWNPKDAFMASALYLRDLGAGTGSYTDEKNAACKYYSGSSCASSAGAPYGASVMAHAATIQSTMIDPLQGV